MMSFSYLKKLNFQGISQLYHGVPWLMTPLQGFANDS